MHPFYDYPAFLRQQSGMILNVEPTEKVDILPGTFYPSNFPQKIPDHLPSQSALAHWSKMRKPAGADGKVDKSFLLVY
jgi:hypothetical protein